MTRPWTATLAVCFVPTAAFAHASERGHVLLLPTGYYLFGGALAVAATFLILSAASRTVLERYATLCVPLGALPSQLEVPIGAVSFALVAVLIGAGFWGSPDPVHNPLPMVVWTVLWVGITLLHGVLGNVWSWLNPWHIPYRALFGSTHRPLLALPARLGRWPAVLLLLGFVWFELIDIAPEDPRRLAAVVTAYWVFTLLACRVFGLEAWMGRGEFLSVFFRIVSRFAVLAPENGRLAVCLPGARIAKAESLDVSGVVFVLVALGSVSFDGLARTFVWLSLIGVNPLEFPGRSLVMGANSLGLILTIAALIAAYAAAVLTGEKLARSQNAGAALGTLVWAIVPIALAYHLSHYLTALLVDGQYALIALSDPFARGWNLLGLTNAHVHAGIVAGHEAAWTIWNIQAAAIVGGHVLAVLLAHTLALRLHGDPRSATISQVPMAVLMVAYTLLGLWLLSTPSIN